MIFNEKYKVWVDKDGSCFKEVRPKPYTRKNKNEKILVPCGCVMKSGYVICKSNLLHRIIWETFNGEIPQGKEIDHIDCNKQNNALSNLRLITHSENVKLAYANKCRKPNTTHKCTCWSDFGTKYKEHFRQTKSDDVKKYCREWYYYKHHGKCSWE